MPDTHKIQSFRAFPEPELFLKRYRDITDRARDSDEAKALWKSEIQKAKGAGVDVKALKLADKIRNMDPAAGQALIRNTILYLGWLGVNILGQEDLFEPSTTGLTEHVMQTHKAWEAGRAGYEAGKVGEPIDSNPHAPGSEEHQRWASEWHDGADDHKTQSASPIKDIKPREGGGDNPEDQGVD